jgi:hypothetical protein
MLRDRPFFRASRQAPLSASRVQNRLALLDCALAKNAPATPLESTLTKVYENKGFYLPLESTLTRKQGGGARLWLTADSTKVRVLRSAIAAERPGRLCGATKDLSCLEGGIRILSDRRESKDLSSLLAPVRVLRSTMGDVRPGRLCGATKDSL